MRHFLKILPMMLLLCNATFAQEEEVWKEPSPESQAYHHYRQKITRPPYGHQKISAIVEKLLADNPEEAAISRQAYAALPLREQFTYNMLHAESYSQNCDAMPPVEDEHLKIFGQLPDAFGEYSWSERQIKFLHANRDSVLAYITASIGRTGRIGVNYKQALLEMNATDMIPLLIRTYESDHKDHDILTLLMNFMKNNRYPPFMTSLSYKKLYADPGSSYQAYLQLNKANETLIIQRANDFYNAAVKK